MKILLINPWYSEIFPPPSIGYLQGALKYWGIDVIAKDLNEAIIDNNNYDLIGVSFHSFSVKYARQIREIFKGRLICGGHHPSALPDQMLSIGYDQVVIGEGENAILSIINGNNDKIIKSESINHYFNNLNEIPFPDYTGLGFSGELGIPIISSRGCPFSCSFCGSTSFWNYKYQMRSSDNVLTEIEKRKSEGYTSWIFYDDNFTANKKRVYEICSLLDGKYKWQAVGRAENLDKDFCNELLRAGCTRLHLGIESLSQEALDRMNKNTTVDRMLKGIEYAENAGISTFCLFIIGLPSDSYNDIQITREKRLKSKINQYGINIAWILPKTDIYKIAKEKGFDDNEYLNGVPFYTYEHSLEELQKWCAEI